MLIVLAALLHPALAATAGEEVTSAPLVAFGWEHDVLDPVFQYSALGDDLSTGWVGGAALGPLRDYNGTSWVATSAPGASITAAYWGSDIYWYGAPTTADLTLTVNGGPAPDKRENRLVAYTGGIPPLGHTNVTLTVNSGFVNLTMADIRHYAYIANIPQQMYIGEKALGVSWWDLPVSAWRVVDGGAVSPNVATTGEWTVRNELGGAEIPYLAGTPGAAAVFKVPPRTTYLQVNGTATNSAARFTVSVSPDPLQAGPATTTVAARAWPHIVDYFSAPLDPGQAYTVTVTAQEGEVGLQSILFVADDYSRRGEFTSTLPPGANDGSGAGGTTSGSSASNGGSSGSRDDGTTGTSGTSGTSGGSGGTGSGTDASPPNDSKTPVGAIAGGVLGGVALLVAVCVVIWFIRKRKRRTNRFSTHHGFDADPVGPRPRPFYQIASGQGSEKSMETAESIALSPMSRDASGAPSPLPGGERLQLPSPAVKSPAHAEVYNVLTSGIPLSAPPTPIEGAQPWKTAAAAPSPLNPVALELKAQSSGATTPQHREGGRAPREEEMQETDAGRIVGAAPPRYNPAWRDE